MEIKKTIATTILECNADSRPIVGYVRSGVIKKLFQAIIDNKKDSDKIYEVNITLHKNEFDDIERLIKSWR